MSKKTLNTANLAALGPQRLADLLIEVSTGSADIKRRLRLELSHNLGASELAQDVRKRLLTLRKSTSFVGWRKRKALIKDLNIQVTMITEKVAPDDPTAAFDLLWLFIEIAPCLYGRLDDSKGDVGDVFRAAIQHFEDIAPRAVLDPIALADRVWAALQENSYGEWDDIIARVASALGAPGLARLTEHAEAYNAAPLVTEPDDHDAIRFLRQLREGDNFQENRKARFVKRCLQDIASVAGDSSAYIAQFSDQDRRNRGIAAEIAVLLLAKDQAETALSMLLEAEHDGSAVSQDAWDAAYIDTLTALGRSDDAQTHRLACFTATLHAPHLRDYLMRLPDFDDVEAEDRAKQHVLSFPSVTAALDFCLNWPDLVSAARLIETRVDELTGAQSALYSAAADALRIRHPRAAVLLWRAVIDHILARAHVARYNHAADHLADCKALDAQIADYGAFPTHDEYVQSLQTRHDLKPSFWANVP